MSGRAAGDDHDRADQPGRRAEYGRGIGVDRGARGVGHDPGERAVEIESDHGSGGIGDDGVGARGEWGSFTCAVPVPDPVPKRRAARSRLPGGPQPGAIV